MQHLVRHAAIPLLAASFALTPTATVADNPPQSAAKLKELRAQINQLNDRVKAEIARKQTLAAKLGKIEQHIGSLHRELTRLAARKEKLSERRHELADEVAASRAEVRAAQQTLSDILRAAFILGRQPRIKLVLEGDDPARAARRLAYYSYFSRARAQRIAELTQTIARYQALQTRLATTERDITHTVAERQKSLAALEASRQERTKIVARLNRDITGKQARIDELKRDLERLQQVVRSVHRDLADIPSGALANVNFKDMRGNLPWPVSGKIVNDFGSSRADNGALRWEAVRIAAPAGTRVRAIAYGRVAYAGWLPFYGLVLMVDHGDGYLTVYGHNEALYKQVGEWVRPGDVITTVGRSGGQARSLLYFQIRHGNRPLDPDSWCREGHPQPQ